MLTEILREIKEQSEKAGRTDVPQLMAVSKTHPTEKILALYREGQKIFGENYVPELIEKKKLFDQQRQTDINLHFIGHLQTNKVKMLLPFIDTIHSVDSSRLLVEIEKRARELNKKIHVYFQINIDDEDTKGGFQVGDLSELENELSVCQFIVPEGLMCIPDPDLDVRGSFQRMKELSLKHGKVLGFGLSMGMSNDFNVAIECGSTMIRVGSKLFGERKKVATK